MTDRELLLMAWNALETITSKKERISYYCAFAVEIEALRARLAQPELVIQARKEGDLIVADLPQVPRGSSGIRTEPTIDGWPLWSGLPQRYLQKMRQAAWKDVRNEYKDDPECCFAMGFDAGYDAVARRVEPPVKESGEGFESLPASPVAWMHLSAVGNVYFRKKPQDAVFNPQPLYTAPPQRKEWQGLTDEEIKDILDCGRGGLVDIKKAEQKLKEKNI
jgi:hypothetical protein